MAIQPFKNIKRLRKIFTIATKYGFGEFTERTKAFLFKKNVTNVGRKLRLLLEDLGPTFIKLGQLLSTREDLFPPSITDELKKLRDEVIPIPFEQIKTRIEEEIHAPLNKVFLSVDEKALASASIGQVHRAKLKDGKEVIIKVKKPQVEEIVKTDIDIMRHTLSIVGRDIKRILKTDLMPFLREFEESIEREMNYEIEATFADIFREKFKDTPLVHVPTIYRQYTTKNIIVMEYIDGIKADDVEKIEQMGFDIKELSREGAEIFWRQIFEFGIFHADPHPSNILLMKDGRICYIDYGMVGRLSEEDSLNLVDMLMGFIQRDAERMFYAIENFVEFREKVNVQAMKRDIAQMIDSYHSLPLEKINLGSVLRDVFSLARRHKAYLSRGSFLLLRAVIIAEGVGRKLYPEFNFVELAQPFFKKFISKKLNIFKILNTMFTHFSIAYILKIRHIPYALAGLLGKMEKGEIDINIRIEGMNDLLRREHLFSRQRNLTLILCAVLVSTALIWAGGFKYTLFGIPIIFIATFVITIFIVAMMIDAERRL